MVHLCYCLQSDPSSLPWLDWNSPVASTKSYGTPGSKFGHWGDNAKPRTPYRFVLAGSGRGRSASRPRDADDNPSDDDGLDDAAIDSQDIDGLRKQLKGRMKIERSLRMAKRKADRALLEARKVTRHFPRASVARFTGDHVSRRSWHLSVTNVRKQRRRRLNQRKR